jgi:predicted transcriptional regulator
MGKINLNSINFMDFLLEASSRMPEEAFKVLDALKKNGAMNMDRVSIESAVNRSSIKFAIIPLETLGLVSYMQYGKAKEYDITPLGHEFLKLVKK